MTCCPPINKCFNRRAGRQREKKIEKRELGKLFKDLTSYNRDSRKDRTEKNREDELTKKKAEILKTETSFHIKKV